MATIPSNFNFPTSKQVPDHAILDAYNKQTYLGTQFNFAASLSLTGTSEVAIFSLSNAQGNGKSLFVNYRSLSCITAAGTCVLKMYQNPTISSAGTAKTPNNLRPANTLVPIAVLNQSPTASANGVLVDFISAGAFANASSNLLCVLDPGQSILITAIPSGSITVLAELNWFEL